MLMANHAVGVELSAVWQHMAISLDVACAALLAGSRKSKNPCVCAEPVLHGVESACLSSMAQELAVAGGGPGRSLCGS